MNILKIKKMGVIKNDYFIASLSFILSIGIEYAAASHYQLGKTRSIHRLEVIQQVFHLYCWHSLPSWVEFFCETQRSSSSFKKIGTFSKIQIHG